MIDILAFFDPEVAIPLALLGVFFGAIVLWHSPTARIAKAGDLLFLMLLADAIIWTFIIGFRGIEYESGSDPTFITWYRSIGTMLMFFGFDLGATAGVIAHRRYVVWQAKRNAVLPHGVHVRRDK